MKALLINTDFFPWGQRNEYYMGGDDYYKMNFLPLTAEEYAAFCYVAFRAGGNAQTNLYMPCLANDFKRKLGTVEALLTTVEKKMWDDEWGMSLKKISSSWGKLKVPFTSYEIIGGFDPQYSEFGYSYCTELKAEKYFRLEEFCRSSGIAMANSLWVYQALKASLTVTRYSIHDVVYGGSTSFVALKKMTGFSQKMCKGCLQILTDCGLVVKEFSEGKDAFVYALSGNSNDLLTVKEAVESNAITVDTNSIKE